MAKLQDQDEPAPLATLTREEMLAQLLSPEELARLKPPVRHGRSTHRDDGSTAELGEEAIEELAVRVPLKLMGYLRRRAETYGEPVEQHLVRIMAEFRVSDGLALVGQAGGNFGVVPAKQ
jgi:hypothetical protein